MKKYFENFLPAFKEYLFAWVFFLGLLLFSIGYFKLFGDDLMIWIYDYSKNIGSLTMSSAVFMGLVKSYQFLKIFKEELSKIIYGKEFFGEREHLEEAWVNISKQLCKQKFSKISTDLFKTIENYYLPINHDFYYTENSLEAHIEYDEDNPGYIVITEEYCYTINTDDADCFNIEFTSKTPFSNEDNKITSYKLLEFKINDKPLEFEDTELKIHETTSKINNKNLNVSFKHKHHCEKNLTKYKIYRKQQKIYSIKENPYKMFTAFWIYKNFKFTLTYPTNMVFEWEGVGVQNKWKLTRDKKKNFKILKAEYNGLLFKKQGFVMFFKEY